MRWTPGGVSGDIEDRRGQGGGGFRGMGFGGGGGMRLGLGGMLVLLVLSLIFKQDFVSMVGGGGAIEPSRPASSAPARSTPEEEKMVQFLSFVLDDSQDTWTRVLPEVGAQYRRAKLVLFRDTVQSACGFGQAAAGPFYCPGDQKVYLDISFFDELHQRFGAAGDFAQAYVVAHEIGHHVQHLLGIEQKVRRAQQTQPRAANQLSVALELQADCLAGVWGHSTAQRRILEEGDVEEGLRAAASIGDDRMQRMAGRAVSPESWTHGSSAQRVEWLKRGLSSGKVSTCSAALGN